MNMPARIPPHSIDAEQTVIGTMLINPKTVPAVMSVLSSEDFYKQSHCLVFSSMEKLFKTSAGIDFITISEDLKTAGNLDQAGGPAYLASLTNIIAATSNIKFHCGIVKEYAKSRNIIAAASAAVDSCYEGMPAGEVFGSLNSVLVGASSEDKSNTDIVRNIVGDVMSEVKGLADGTIKETGIKTGFVDLDKITRGFQKSDLIILAGRPSMGKTTLAMNMVTSAASLGCKALVFSLEMSRQKLVKKQLSSISGVSVSSIDTGYTLNETTWPMLNKAAGFVGKLNVTIDDSSALDIAQVQARAKLEAMKNGVDLIMVDYLQLMKAAGFRNNREREVSEISAGLKALAKDLEIPVVALSQLNRGLESRTDKRPLMSDLRDSGSIEQDADVIAFVYRDEVYNTSPDNPDKGLAELLVRKNRCGETGAVKLAFEGAYCRFGNLAHEEYK